MRNLKQFFEPKVGNRATLAIHGVGIQESMPACVIRRPTGKPDWLLMYFSQTTWCTDEDGWQLRDGGSFIIWPANEPHQYGHDQQAWSHSWIHCDGKLLRKYLRQASLPLNRVFTLRQPQLFERCLDDLHQELTNWSEPDLQIVRNTLDSSIRQIGRAVHEKQTSPLPQNMLASRRHIEQHYMTRVTLEDLAAVAHLSTAHFCVQYKKYFQTTPVEHVLSLRLSRASQLLSDSLLGVTQIAASVGYDDVYHFSKLFKRRMGVSPLAYRKRAVGHGVTEAN